MPTVFTASSDEAVEESTYIVTASFEDEDGNAVVPKTMSWSLTDKDSTIINSQEDIAIISLAASVDIVLKGDDLQITAGKSKERRFLVLEGTYDSDAGADLPLKDQLEFRVVNIKKVT